MPETSKRFNWLKMRQPSTLPELFIFSWLWSIPVMFVAGVIVILIYTSGVPSGLRWSVFGTAIAIGSSSFFVGGIVGFLFGIPRTVQGSVPSTTVTQYQGNTNLEQISDWLTKIIVGIGLVQIGHIIPALSELGESIKAPLGGQASSPAFGLGMIITYASLGFFYYYLWSRSLFARELGIANPPQRQKGGYEQAKSSDSSP